MLAMRPNTWQTTTPMLWQSLVLAIFFLTSVDCLNANSCSPQDPTTATDPAQAALDREIAAARQHANELGNIYSTMKKLARKGSISQQKLRQAYYEYRLANLNILALEDPTQQQQIELAKAELKFQLKSREYEISSRLFQRGSISEMQFERSKFNRDVARLELEAAQDSRNTKLHDIKIAQRKLDFIAQEHRRVKQLWDSQMISNRIYERWTRYLRDSEQELAIAKKALGVRVIVVDPPGISNHASDRK